jgi:hypothetical protein
VETISKIFDLMTNVLHLVILRKFTYRIPGPFTLELDGIPPDVEVAEVATRVGQQQHRSGGDPLTDHLQ